MLCRSAQTARRKQKRADSKKAFENCSKGARGRRGTHTPDCRKILLHFPSRSQQCRPCKHARPSTHSPPWLGRTAAALGTDGRDFRTAISAAVLLCSAGVLRHCNTAQQSPTGTSIQKGNMRPPREEPVHSRSCHGTRVCSVAASRGATQEKRDRHSSTTRHRCPCSQRGQKRVWLGE
jgi:hypothetical protein